VCVCVRARARERERERERESLLNCDLKSLIKIYSIRYLFNYYPCEDNRWYNIIPMKSNWNCFADTDRRYRATEKLLHAEEEYHEVLCSAKELYARPLARSYPEFHDVIFQPLADLSRVSADHCQRVSNTITLQCKFGISSLTRHKIAKELWNIESWNTWKDTQDLNISARVTVCAIRYWTHNPFLSTD